MKKFLLLVSLLGCLSIITLAQAYTGTAKLSWTPPSTFTDGTPLVPAIDLSGFRIYSGNTPGVYGASILVSIGTATTYTMNIGTGITYFSVSAVGVNGLEGARSTEVSKTVTVPPPGGCTLFVE